MKKSLFIILSFFLCYNLFAAGTQINSESIKAYRTALEYYEKMEYGKALKYAEDSILYRKNESEYELKVLHNSLSAKKVISAGSEINKVLEVLEERKEKESIKIINYYVKSKGIEYFENDITKIQEYITEIKEFPEAYKIIGDIYKLEGEYEFAEQYYNLALQHCEIMDIPDEKYDILYMLAQISKSEGDFAKMEVRLLNILVDDPFYKDKALFNSMMGTIKSDKQNSLEKYFNLYRASSYYCLNAYNELIQYYINFGEDEKALRLSALTVLTAFTKIYDILKARNPEYEYSDLGAFFQELALYPDVVEWGINNNVWRSFNLLAEITVDSGYVTFGKELLTVLVHYMPDEYWQKNAVLQLEELD